MTIQVTQFIRPNGRQEIATTTVDNKCGDNYKLMRELGCRLTAEVLRTGEISLCIEHPEHGVFDIRIESNGPAVKHALEDMLMVFSKERLDKWVAVRSQPEEEL